MAWQRGQSDYLPSGSELAENFDYPPSET